MKKSLLFSFFILASMLSHAQAVTTLTEPFTTGDCPDGTHYLTGWAIYNPIDTTMPNGEWTCTATEGRSGTPGMKCSGFYDITVPLYHTDTSYLITPLLDLSSYQYAYLFFDSKTSIFTGDSRLSFLRVPNDTLISADTSTFTDLSALLSPGINIGDTDSTNWVTHVIDITAFRGTHPLYFAFRYSSGPAYGSIWYIDNINVINSPYPLNIPKTGFETTPLTILGNSSSNEITFSLSCHQKTQYELSLYDIMGRQVHTELLNATEGIGVYHIKDLGLLPGMYILKVIDGRNVSTVKTVIQ